MKHIAIFASGNGSNAQAIVEYFRNSTEVRVSLILSNNPGAYVLQRAALMGIPSAVFSKVDFYDTNNVLELLFNNQIDFIVLAGFLWLVPKNLIMAFSGAILNIHPALLPKYGGKGMYGNYVHKAILEAGDKESGITIHWVNEHYDEGNIVVQAKCAIDATDTHETLAQKIQLLEYEHYPKAIEECIKQLF